MNNQIAVLLDEWQQLTSFFETTFIYIYEKICEWEVTQIIEVKDLSCEGKNDIKNFTVELIEKLKCCKVIVGTLIIGVPYYLLTRAGYELLEAPSFTILLLEQICEDYCKSQEKEREINEWKEQLIVSNRENLLSEGNISRTPTPLDEAGNYFCDLIAVQKTYPEISSKKVLLPFFSNTLFQSLKIKCSHVMPWLEDYLEQRNLIANTNREQGNYIIIITHKLCSC